jgi:hypothetical protein
MANSKAMSTGRAGLPPGVRVHKFTRTRDFGTVAKAALDTGGSLQFSLDQVPGYTEFTNLYDAYSIDSVDITFVWWQPYSGVTSGAAQSPCMIITPDYDDAATPATFDEVGEFSTASLHPMSLAKNSFTITVKPRVATSLFRAGVTSGYGWGGQSQVIDCGTADVPHYGLKWFTMFHSNTYTPDSSIRMIIRYNLSCYASR